jgi:tRNA-specific 2-thiouridylase
VAGIHFVTGYEDPSLQPLLQADPPVTQPWAVDITDQLHEAPIFQLARQLAIDLHILDCRVSFKRCVVDYFTDTYHLGQTPNPCLICNAQVKFGTVLKFARERGATFLATGHYARIHKDENGHYRLHKGIDPRKDQSYFLAFLTQAQLSQARFPLGHLTKKEVVALAAAQGLRSVSKAESQDICFIRGRSYVDFLASGQDVRSQPGLIENTQGHTIGQHDGLHRFTIGQRRGINCPAPHPYYVVRLDAKRNRLVVGTHNDLMVDSFRVTKLNWITDPPQHPRDVSVRIRYRHAAVKATLIPQDDGQCEVRLHALQKAITPGQGAVFYNGDEVLGGGIIDIESDE